MTTYVFRDGKLVEKPRDPSIPLYRVSVSSYDLVTIYLMPNSVGWYSDFAKGMESRGISPVSEANMSRQILSYDFAPQPDELFYVGTIVLETDSELVHWRLLNSDFTLALM